MHGGLGLPTLSEVAAPPSSSDAQPPTIIKLRRESVPVHRHGRIASFKTSYSGLLNIGSPAQEFRVLFDTGSGHLVVPASECASDSCLVHRRYSLADSTSATAVNGDGTPVYTGDLCDQLTVGFGTGEVTGEFVKDIVCLGAKEEDRNVTQCSDMFLLAAIEMSTHPFLSFGFDGILGLGLKPLSLNRRFNFLDAWSNKTGGLRPSHFGVFLTEGEDGEESEIAFGGHNQQRLLEPVTWSPVANPETGFWQVSIRAVRVNGIIQDFCNSDCFGIMDTGTSHLGIPSPFDVEITKTLTQPAHNMLDCRLAEAPILEIELDGFNLTLHAENYMRRLPLREGVSVGSEKGVTMDSESGNSSLVSDSDETKFLALNTSKHNVIRHCRPKTMPVNMPPPLGPKLFILGEPVLHRYYTVYDPEAMQIGFGLANNRRNNVDPAAVVDRRGSLPPEVDILLMQQHLFSSNPSSSISSVFSEVKKDASVFFQMKSVLAVVVRARLLQ